VQLLDALGQVMAGLAAVTDESFFGDPGGPETFIFRCNEDGECEDKLHLPGSKRGIQDIDAVLEGIGYTPVYADV
jgi:hypothetical protein